MPNEYRAGRRITAVALVAVLCLLTPLEIAASQVRPMPPDALIRLQVNELQAAGSEVEVRLVRGTKVDGRILWVGAASFTLRAKNGQEWTWPFSDVVSVKKKGLSWIAKTAIIWAGALVVLCVAPFPIGLLCHRDPS